MKTLIPAHCFTSAQIFAREQVVFGRVLWNFVCLAAELKWERDCVFRLIGGLPVLLRRRDGQVNAFCQMTPGIPRGRFTSHQAVLDHCIDSPDAVQEYFPVPIEVDVCGQFIFVKTQPGGPTLAEFLGDWSGLIGELTGGFSERFFQTDVDVQANWKLLVENGFDTTHLEFVHPTTINQVEFEDFSWRGDERCHPEALTLSQPALPPGALPRLDCQLRHSLILGAMSERQVAAYRKIYDPLFPERAYRSDHYIHINLFPNVIITSLMGYFSVILNYEPVAADQTIIHFYMVPSKQGAGAEALTSDFIHQHPMGSQNTYLEDIVLQQHLQRMAPSVDRPGIFGRLENKMKAFEAAYLCAMGMNLLN